MKNNEPQELLLLALEVIKNGLISSHLHCGIFMQNVLLGIDLKLLMASGINHERTTFVSMKYYRLLHSHSYCTRQLVVQNLVNAHLVHSTSHMYAMRTYFAMTSQKLHTKVNYNPKKTVCFGHILNKQTNK